MELKDLLGNGIFFLLDILLVIILIPVILKLRNRNKINHLTRLTITAINELMEVGGSMMIKFNQTAFQLNEETKQIKQMTIEEKEKFDFSPSKTSKLKKESLDWLIQYSKVFEKEVNSFRSTIELFSPHFEHAQILIFISNLNQNTRYVIGSMEAIIISFRLGGEIPDDLFGSINGAYKKMYNDVIQNSQHKKFKSLQTPKSIEELYKLLKN